MKICPTCQTCYEDDEVTCREAGHGPPAPSRPGSRLVDGRYRLDRLLGRGGMGAVYAGVHVELDRPAAVKMLLPDLVSDPLALGRFKQEARLAARLNHPNVAGTYDFGSLPSGESYIVMELVEGETLEERLAVAGALPLREAVDVARQAADGVESAHRGGVIHRDLKPSNIVLARDHHGSPLVKVLDFGVARLKGEATGRLDITLAGAVVGTPRYMSPEQCAGHKADARSDVYSLGVILYEMIAGRAPFDALTAPLLALKQVKEPPPPLERLRPDVPAELARLVMWALSKDPADRPQTAAEFSGALRVAEEKLAHLTPDTSRPVEPAEESRERGQGRAVAAGGAVVAGGGVAAGRTSPAPAPAAGRHLLTTTLAVVFLVSAIATFLFLWWRGHPAPAVGRDEAPAARSPSQSPAPEGRVDADQRPAPEATPAALASPGENDDGRASEADKKALQSALAGWIAATNSRDVRRQLSYYAPRLDVFYLTRNVSRDAVLDEKREAIGRADRVSIKAGAPTVELSRDRLTAVMTFRKSYVIEEGRKRRDGEVVQELRWSRPGPETQEWKITSERDLRVVR